MYATCLFCNAGLGSNEALATFPVGRRLAFDVGRGRLWVICELCHRWNLSPLDERWEAIEDCERLFRASRQRYSTDNIGLAVVKDGVALVRIGPALKPELAAWRYGRTLRELLPLATRDPVVRWARRWTDWTQDGVEWSLRRVLGVDPGCDLATWFRIYGHRGRIVALAATDRGDPTVIRARHIPESELLRPDPHQPWQLSVHHDGGVTVVTGDVGLRLAGKLLATLNGDGASNADVSYALAKVEDSGNPDGYFARVAEIAMRTSWGRHPNALPGSYHETPPASGAERLALYLTRRSFWGRGGIGSEPRTRLIRLPLVDRLALEMAANEDAERQAMAGELNGLEAAWREAETIAAIADGLFDDPPRPVGCLTFAPGAR